MLFCLTSAQREKKMRTNKDGIPLFHLIPAYDYVEELEHLASKSKKKIKDIISCEEEPSFENTILAIELASEEFYELHNFVGMLVDNGNPDIQPYENKIFLISQEYEKYVYTNPHLYERVKEVKEKASSFDVEEESLTESTFKGFKEYGFGMDKKASKRLNYIRKRLGLLYIKYDRNVSDETNKVALRLKKEDSLKEELPQSLFDKMQQLSFEEGNPDLYSINLSEAVYGDFIRYSSNRMLKEKLFNKKRKVSSKNKNLAKEIINLRLEKAKLLGYKNYADYSLEEEMVESTKELFELLDPIVKKVKKKVKSKLKDFSRILKLPQRDIKPFDLPWAIDRDESVVHLDHEKFKEFLELNTVLWGFFKLAKKLWGFNIVETHAPKPHEDVKVFSIKKGKKVIGLLYVDPYTHRHKSPGAWALEARSNVKNFGVTSVCFNFMKEENGFCFLDVEDARTVFHELGHAFHALLNTSKYVSTSSFFTSTDFIELPSTLMEYYFKEPKVIDMYARHYKTGGKLTKKDKNKLIEYLNGDIRDDLFLLSYLGAVYLDLDINMTKSPIKSLEELKTPNFNRINLPPQVASKYTILNFLHSFSEHYSARYYSYLWSEVLAADVFAMLTSRGHLSREVFSDYSKFLLQGSYRRESIMFRDFMGRKPNVKNYLKAKKLT